MEKKSAERCIILSSCLHRYLGSGVCLLQQQKNNKKSKIINNLKEGLKYRFISKSVNEANGFQNTSSLFSDYKREVFLRCTM